MEVIDAGRVRIGVSATRVSGRDYVDVRQFYTDAHGVLRPTQNGVLLPIECLADVVKSVRREYDKAKLLDPATLYYFKEVVEDKNAERRVAGHKVFSTIREAVHFTPTQHGAEKSRGYIFRSSDYVLQNGCYVFKPSKPYAKWNSAKSMWQKWKPLSK
jgi:hypothetical protein